MPTPSAIHCSLTQQTVHIDTVRYYASGTGDSRLAPQADIVCRQEGSCPSRHAYECPASRLRSAFDDWVASRR